MARIILSNGENNDSVIGGSVINEVFGANGSEQIRIGIGGRAVLDASFNRGGDTINLLGTASSYDIRQSGSSIILTDDAGGTITIPVGTSGATIAFADASRTLVFNTTTNQIELGGQVITTTEVDVNPGNVGPSGDVFDLTPGVAAGATVARITGDQSVRFDVTRNDNQVTGLDLDGNGVIDNNGAENVNPTDLDDTTRFGVLDAYSRNKANEGDTSANFLGNIAYDGTGFGGDGVNTDGNIVLGGLGEDTILGGIGNDFLTGGGVSQAQRQFAEDNGLPAPQDKLFGGRNADFFFADLSLLDNAGGNGLVINGGNTTDDFAVGDNTAQDRDWLLIEVADDEDGTVIDLAANFGFDPNDETLSVETGAGQAMSGSDIENVDASGNLYGFLNDFAGSDLVLGEGGGANTNGEYQGIGSSAQLEILGSVANNILIGGYDNDRILGRTGNDLLFGGNLNYSLFNPNATGIVNDGMDELFGGEGADSLVWEADGGVYEGESELNVESDSDDTLWLTSQSLGSQTAADLTTDGVLRFDLGTGGGSNVVGGLDAFSGYGGADLDAGANYTADQTNYAAGVSRTATQDVENVITTGLGGIDFLSAGSNDPDLTFNNQQNFAAYNGDLDVRGTNGENTIYVAGGNDLIEGREGDDFLSGGEGNDDFLFNLGGGDDIDVIHRQLDADGDGLWDVDADTEEGLFGRDFGLGGSSTTGPSSLAIDFSAANLGDPNVSMTSFSLDIGGTTFAVTDTAALQAATTVSELAALVNAAFNAQDSNVTVTASGDTLTITDATPTGGREISDTAPEGYAVAISVVAPGSGSLGLPVYTAPGTDSTEDRLVFVAYEDRADNERVDDDASIGADTLGDNAYAQDLVVSFNRDGSTVLAEAQSFQVDFENLAVEDTVTVTVNGVDFTLTVGRALDGSLIAGESTDDFAARLATYITDFLDNDTAAGQLDADYIGQADPNTGQFVIRQVGYANEETVFMQVSVNVDDNSSGGEGATAEVTNTSATDITLYDFDGRDGALNADNVLFVGNTDTSRSVLQTAAAAGGTLLGSDALVVNVTGDAAINSSAAEGVNGTALAFNAVKNPTTGNLANYAVHGDDQLFTGAGNDDVEAGTGDDRVYGSLGLDTIDGGKDIYLVDGVLRVLNDFEAAQIDALPGTIDISLVDDGAFDDTLMLQQSDVDLPNAGGSYFRISLDLSVDQANGGAGKVITNGDEAANQTLFTNFENIRTVSGLGTLARQGNDALDLSISVNPLTGAETLNTLNTLYYLDNSGNAGRVFLDRTADSVVNPADLLITVDGVENLFFGSGDDQLFIDETEAGKGNYIEGGLGSDTVNYAFDIGGANNLNPSVTLTVNGAAGTDYVDMTGGSLAAGDTPRDTLVDIETVNFSDALDNPTLIDTLNVAALAGGAVVDMVNGQIRSGGLGSSTIELEVGGIGGFEVVQGGAGNDTVVVADSPANANLDAGLPTDVTFDSFLSYDLTDDRAATVGSPVRLTVADLRTIADGTDPDTADESDIPESENLGLYQFNLGAGTADRIDYSNETGNIAVSPNLSASSANFNVLVLGGDLDLNDAGDRVDRVSGGEQIVASQGESIIDLTASLDANGDYANRDVVITYQAAADSTLADVYDPNANMGAGAVRTGARREYTVLLEDAATTTPFDTLRFIEYRDANGADLFNQAAATWDRIEGSDGNEKVQFTSAQEDIEHTLNLRGGDNSVFYNLQTNGVEVRIDSLLGGVTDLSIEGKTAGGVLTGVIDDVTSHNALNEVSVGSLTVVGSTLFRDSINLASFTDDSLYLLGEVEDSVSKLEVTFGTAGGDVELTLIGFEELVDGQGDDVYEFADLANFFDTFRSVTDNGVVDSDTAKLTDGALDDLTAAVGVNFADDTIELEDLEDAIDGANDNVEGFNFTTLDISEVTTQTDSVITNDPGEKVILGDVALIGDNADALVDVDGFETVAFTTTTGMGTSVTIDMDLGEFRNAGGVLFNFNAATTFDFSAVTTAMNVTVVDTGGTGVTVIGSSAADTVFGDGGNDVIQGGAGADLLDGGFVPEVREVQTIVINGAFGADGSNDGQIEVGGITLTEGAAAVPGSVVVDGADADTIGAAFDAISVATWEAALGGVDLDDVSYNATTNALSFTFASGENPNAGDVLAASGGYTANTDTGALNIGSGTDTDFSARGESADTFVFLAGDSTEGAMDIISNFSIGAIDDVIDVSGIEPMHTEHSFSVNYGGVLADFAAVRTAAEASIGLDDSPFIASDGTDSWVFFDDNHDNVLDATDTLIQLADTTAAGIDANNFIF